MRPRVPSLTPFQYTSNASPTVPKRSPTGAARRSAERRTSRRYQPKPSYSPSPAFSQAAGTGSVRQAESSSAGDAQAAASPARKRQGPSSATESAVWANAGTARNVSRTTRMRRVTGTDGGEGSPAAKMVHGARLRVKALARACDLQRRRPAPYVPRPRNPFCRNPFLSETRA